MVLSKKTNTWKLIAIFIPLIVASGYKSGYILNISYTSVWFWIFPLFMTLLLGFGISKALQPLAKFNSNKMTVLGQVFPYTELEWAKYIVHTDHSHELIYKVANYLPHHIMISEHPESIENNRLYKFLKQSYSNLQLIHKTKASEHSNKTLNTEASDAGSS